MPPTHVEVAIAGVTYAIPTPVAVVLASLLQRSEQLADRLTEVDGAVCRVCGCTQNNACEGGCWWVTENLCSTCHGAAALDHPALPAGLDLDLVLTDLGFRSLRSVA